MQKHWCPLVHMEIKKYHYCVKVFKHGHVQFQEHQYLLSVFGIHHAMQQDTHLNLQKISSISLALTPKYYTEWRTEHHMHNYNYLHPIQFLVVLHFHHTLIIFVFSLVYESHFYSSCPNSEERLQTIAADPSTVAKFFHFVIAALLEEVFGNKVYKGIHPFDVLTESLGKSLRTLALSKLKAVEHCIFILWFGFVGLLCQSR